MSVKMKDLEEGTRFIDGAEYRGTWNPLGMEGPGKIVLPHGTAFQGDFREGTLHGHGSAHWPRGQRIDGIWVRGECRGKRYVFDDGLIYVDTDWEYCKFPDRRYLACLKHGLRPAGRTLRTNNRDDFVLPPMSYDCGIGIFDPRTYCVLSYRHSKKILEIPAAPYAEWIKRNCQKAWSEPTGYREDLYENWFSRKLDDDTVPASLPFSNESFERWWKRLSTLRRDKGNGYAPPSTLCARC